jgi:CRP-like cAMP-binding protein
MRVAPVSEGVLAKLIAAGNSMAEPAGAVLFRRGEPPFGIFVVRQGSISLRLEGDDGAILIDRVAGADSVIGLPATLSGTRYSLSAVAIETSEVTHVNNQSLFDLIRSDSSVGLELMRALGDEVVQMRSVWAGSATGEKTA